MEDRRFGPLRPGVARLGDSVRGQLRRTIEQVALGNPQSPCKKRRAECEGRRRLGDARTGARRVSEIRKPGHRARPRARTRPARLTDEPGTGRTGVPAPNRLVVRSHTARALWTRAFSCRTVTIVLTLAFASSTVFATRPVFADQPGPMQILARDLGTPKIGYTARDDKHAHTMLEFVPTTETVKN